MRKTGCRPGDFVRAGPHGTLRGMGKTLMNAAELHACLDRLAQAVVADAPRDAELVIIGIRRRGEVIAKRLMPLLARHGKPAAHHGALDITLYRDDLSTIGPQAVVRGTEIDFPLTDRWVVLVDDVLYTGRSVRAALDALIDLGRPRAIRLLVLAARSGRELPIQADIVGMDVKTTPSNIVKVKLVEVDGEDGVELV